MKSINIKYVCYENIFLKNLMKLVRHKKTLMLLIYTRSNIKQFDLGEDRESSMVLLCLTVYNNLSRVLLYSPSIFFKKISAKFLLLGIDIGRLPI
jgi:HJR/Mrr/RecB family endonuclease